MSNTITIELCKEDRQRIDELIAFAGLIVSEMKSRPTGIQGELLQAEVSIGLPVEGAAHLEPVQIEDPAPAPDPVPDPVPEVKPVSLAEFQKAVTRAVAKGPKQKESTRAIINKYAPSVSEVPEDKRAEIMDELAKI